MLRDVENPNAVGAFLEAYYENAVISLFESIVKGGKSMIYKDEAKDENLGIVVAVEGYAQRHNMRGKDVFALLQKHEVNKMLRSAWNVLHTQSLEESIEYVEDVLSWKQK